MSVQKPLLPFYQNIESLNFPGAFTKEVVISAMRYQPKPGELIISTYPKCGTTWTQVIVYLIRTKGQPAQDLPQFYRKMPFIEFLGTEYLDGAYAIKTHLPFDRVCFSPEAKYLCVARNPKDALVSLFHHTQTVLYLFDDGEFDVFFEIFMEGKVDFGDFFDHVLGWYEHINEKNVLFLTYEELKKDFRNCVTRIARFMGEEYAEMLQKEPEVMEKIVKYSSMDEMKKVFNKHFDEMVGNMNITKEDIDAMPIPAPMKHARKFVIEHRTPSSKVLNLVRKGLVGGWKNTLTKEQNERLDERIKARLQGTELYEMWKDIM